eukprot:scaffold77006_cov23-Cyclotella_meneghiniana.AAC.1
MISITIQRTPESIITYDTISPTGDILNYISTDSNKQTHQVIMVVNQRPVFSSCTQSSTPRKIPPFERRSSPPIPIKSTIHAEDSGSHDSSDDLESYYNQLTWRMYNRITEARRIRAYVRQSNSFDSEDYACSPIECKSPVSTNQVKSPTRMNQHLERLGVSTYRASY